MARPRRQPEPQDQKVVRFKEIQARARRRALPAPDPEAERRRNRANVAALLFAAFLIAIGWILVQKLGESARLQDCVMSGRTNCIPIAEPPTQ
jgi:hypothetical protein